MSLKIISHSSELLIRVFSINTKIYFVALLLIVSLQYSFSQTPVCDSVDRIVVKGVQNVIPSHTLKMYLNTDSSTMYYCPDFFSESYGGNYYLNYVDEGGSGMDSYPNIVVGGVSYGGTWYSGDKEIVGMPTTIENINETMNFEWKISQVDAFDVDDKWMASINFIFDNYGDETSEPDNAMRDYDIVVKYQSHNFSDDLEDLTIPAGNRIWYFARWNNGSLKPYEIEIEGITYKYAVRYKFFVGTDDKDDKVHVKFIPYVETGIPPVLKVNIKEIIQVSKDYIQYANMPDNYRELAYANVALDNAWLKSINAGYEVYTGKSQLNIDKFKVNPQQVVGINSNNNSILGSNALVLSFYPNPTKGLLNIEMNRKFAIIEIVVRNAFGRVVTTEYFTNSKHIDFEITDVPGIYFVEIKTESAKKSVFKVIKI